jgi:hypothetical protein
VQAKALLAVLLAVASLLYPLGASAQRAVLFDGRRVASLVHDGSQSARLAAELLGRDLAALTGRTPAISPDLTSCTQLCVVVGTHDSPLVRAVARESGVDLSVLRGEWERYARVLVRGSSGRRYLLIAGSDRRGSVWGVIDLTRELGVSAWEWWADVAPRRVSRLAVDGARRVSTPPSVRYRGIFLNDEDWGLQPWAAKTHEPEVGDIGPRTYARIFELMWRLKANLIWPAMHDSTRPFYQVPGNAEAAGAHDIVVGTSHAEPMMRNNVREWDERADGAFNFFTNRARMTDYWRRRVEEVKGYENLTTIGLRGKHDSALEGADTPDQAREATAAAITVQRELLAQAQGRPADQVPQALTLYKEVLDIYGTGLQVPDDVTLVWPEDNYGYISQLPTPQEQARRGGSGVYYHISYWGRPHDYLWLATTHPALIREQMDRAWQLNARRVWMVNVGDIKPGEYLTQYFLDLAFDHRTFAETPRAHLRRWAAGQFGETDAERIAEVLTEYYDLAFERRPEFIGFNQVEPTRPVRLSDYVRTGGAEAQLRIDRYADLVARAEALAARMPADRRDAFFQLVLYPVRGAANINIRTLRLDLAALHARQGRASVNAYVDQARAAHAAIVADTAAYNAQNGGKWRGIMDMAPRRLPVFAEPAYPQVGLADAPGCAVDTSELSFVAGRPAAHAVTIYSRGRPADWTLTGLQGLAARAVGGTLNAANGFEQRVLLGYDGTRAVDAGTIECAGQRIRLTARLTPGGTVELDLTISLAAADAVAPPDWERIPGLGSRGTALRSRLTLASRDTPAADPLVFDFRTSKPETDLELRVVALPAHPLTSSHRLRLGVQLDDGPLQILDFETHGRSEAWKQGVLSNSIARGIPIAQLAAGAHRLRIHALDPGFLLDRIDLRLDGAPDRYGAPPIR